ncbi:MAG: c-type cytochrome [Thiohalocapsa sp.]|nr:c-type cytochrome [Thiohalocapsa sp.]MCF7991642.1 c-type cytochrome [Thiohalocapsa sp.]
MKTTRRLFALLLAGGCALTAAGAMAATPAEVAQAEYDEVMQKTPDVDNGRRAYLTCAVCHLPEGWGSVDGTYPQIAGQLRTVIIKQLADFRAGNRDNPLMYPFSVPGILGGPQEIADVAAYVAQLPMTPHNALGPGTALERGKQLYEENCLDCHGADGRGDVAEHIPAVAAQHYPYLMRQFDMIRSGQRKNADSEMVKQIEGFGPAEQSAVLDYTARLRPPAEKLAVDGWTNPDFPHYVRDALGIRARPPAMPRTPTPSAEPPPAE